MWYNYYWKDCSLVPMQAILCATLILTGLLLPRLSVQSIQPSRETSNYQTFNDQH